jgi:hypothetical protein
MTKKKFRLFFACALIFFSSSVVVAQVAPSRLPADRLDGPPLAEVLVLGSYHMGNPGRDIFNLKADDVLAPKRQAEIRELLDVLARFRPTKIAIEADSNSPKIKQYQDYLAGKYELGRDERDQIGFRLGKELNLPKIYGIDEQEDFPYPAVQDYAKAHGRVGEEGDYAGAGLLTDWYKRNIRIHTHLLNIIEPGDRVLVIYGYGHLRILRQDVQADPTLTLRTIEELASGTK